MNRQRASVEVAGRKPVTSRSGSPAEPRRRRRRAGRPRPPAATAGRRCTRRGRGQGGPRSAPPDRRPPCSGRGEEHHASGSLRSRDRLAAVAEHPGEDVRSVGHRPVDSELQEALHVCPVVDRPHVDPEPGPVGGAHQSAGDDPDALVGFGWLQRLERRSVQPAGRNTLNNRKIAISRMEAPVASAGWTQRTGGCACNSTVETGQSPPSSHLRPSVRRVGRRARTRRPSRRRGGGCRPRRGRVASVWRPASTGRAARTAGCRSARHDGPARARAPSPE